MSDMYEGIQVISWLLYSKNTSHAHRPEATSDKDRMRRLRDIAHEMYNFAYTYQHRLGHRLEDSKKEHLRNAIHDIDEFHKLCRLSYDQYLHQEKQKPYDEHLLLTHAAYFHKLDAYFQGFVHHLHLFAKHGSFYLVRHCEKTKFADKVGISTTHKLTQAKLFADDIIQELLISPKPVRVAIYHSTSDRTQDFAGLVFSRITQGGHLPHHKLEGANQKSVSAIHGVDPRLGEDNFTKEMLRAYEQVYVKLKKEGKSDSQIEWYCLEEMYFNKHKEFTTVTSEVKKCVSDMDNFVHQHIHSLTHDDVYTLCIGFSHSFLIDWYLFHKLGVHEYKRIIDTADFLKIEEGDSGFKLYFRHKWHAG